MALPDVASVCTHVAGDDVVTPSCRTSAVRAPLALPPLLLPPVLLPPVLLPRLSHGAEHALQSSAGDHVSTPHGCGASHACWNGGTTRLWQYRCGTRMPVVVAQVTDRVWVPVPHVASQRVQGPATHW